MKILRLTLWPFRSRTRIVVTALVFALVLVASALFAVSYLIRSSGAYQDGVELARSSPKVASALGKPLDTGWFPTGSIHVTGPSGEASLAVRLHGPEATGTLYIEAEKHAGLWHFTLAEVAVEGRSDRINLLEAHEGG